MMAAFIYAVLGLCLGSFVNALVWRLHENRRSVRPAKKPKDYKPLSIWHGRSMCPNCRHQLAWYDLLPVVSWVILGGKCRYCKKNISWQYPVTEIITAGLFVISYFAWPYDLSGAAGWAAFLLWLAIVTTSVALAVYDYRWMILPTRLVYVLLVLSLLFVFSIAYSASDYSLVVDGLVGSAVYGGFFWTLYQMSSGKWIGGGDVRLAFALGLLLGWKLGIVSLVAASYMGTLIFIALFLSGRYKKKMRIPFGPLLLLGSFIALIWGSSIIKWYFCLSGC